MKHILILILLCTTLYSCNLNSGNTASINYEAQCEYENPTVKLGIGMLIWDGGCSNTIAIYNDTLLSEVTEVNLCEHEKNVCPYFYKPDYEIAHFIVNNIYSDSYEILYNFDKKGYIKKNAVFQFKPWDQYLVEQPLGANIKGEIFEFEIHKVVGDSIYISENKRIRWRKDEQLLVDLFFLM